EPRRIRHLQFGSIAFKNRRWRWRADARDPLARLTSARCGTTQLSFRAPKAFGAVLSGDRFAAREGDALRTAHTTAQRHDREPARRPANALDCWCGHAPFVSDRRFALAARRLRSGEAGIYVLRDNQGRTLVLSAHATRTRGNKAAAGRLDFSRAVCANAIVGSGVATAIVSCCGCDRNLVISCRAFNGRTWCKPPRPWRGRG